MLHNLNINIVYVLIHSIVFMLHNLHINIVYVLIHSIVFMLHNLNINIVYVLNLLQDVIQPETIIGLGNHMHLKFLLSFQEVKRYYLISDNNWPWWPSSVSTIFKE
jgi:hypothetical protein